MFNSYKPISQILQETPKISIFLQDAEKYYAHTKPGRTPETLEEHIELVQKKFGQLCKTHHLDYTIDLLINDFINVQFKPESQLKLGGFLKRLFVNIVVFHDYGKVNENFQAHPDKMNNLSFQATPNSPIQSFHSSLGAYLFIVKHFQEFYSMEFSPDEQRTLSLSVLAFSYPIFRHHSRFLNDRIQEKICFSENEVHKMKSYLVNYQFNVHSNFAEKVPLHTDKIFTQQNIDKLLTSFPLYALLKLSFSLLTASDYMATGEYMNNLPIEDFGILNGTRIDRIFKYLTEKEFLADGRKNYNYNTYQKLQNYQFQRPSSQSNENLNMLRQEMAIEVIQNIRQNQEKNLFYIEAPTGGGKTNLSMLATVELLKANPKLNKVFYVFPFTTLITQTHKVILETLGLSSDEVAQLHSKEGYKTKEEQAEDGQYGKNKLNFIDNLFINYPFCLLSHIKFFDILKTNEKETNYILHRLANSVVVIDELQSYNPSHWDKVIYFIRNYAHYFNIKFILMSATLPKLGNLKIIENQVADFVYLLPNAKEDYFQNPNFSKRVQFDFELTKIKENPLDHLAQVLLEKSKDYAEKNFGDAKPKGSVYTIIEFIFKKTASEFYKIIKSRNHFFDEIFVLSGTILEHRRKQIINSLKNPTNRKKRILLITTQVVEAGVDIDMDIGFKDKSLIDSDEQLAGRINRNVNKQDCVLYLFQYNKEVIIYGKDKRYKATKEHLKQEDYEEILRTKNFDKLYSIVLNGIEKWNDTAFAINFSEYRDNFKYLNFKEINQKFKLIEQDNLSVFVPLPVPIEVDGISPNSKDKIFSDNELSFLAKAGIYPNNSCKIEGSQVFDLYLDLIHNKRPDFIEQVVSMRTLQGIMSKFIFSVFSNDKVKKKFETFSDVTKSEFGYTYLVHWNTHRIYSEEFGIDDSQFDNLENQFL